MFSLSTPHLHKSFDISDDVTAVVSKGPRYRSIAVVMPNISSGNAFNFTITVTQRQVNTEYSNSVKTKISGYPSFTVTLKNNVKWDLDKMKLFVGGFSFQNPGVSPSYFHGCLSDVVFQGVDIIDRYFSQYPNNINPIRGSEVGSPPYATAMQNCSIVTNLTSTVGPTSSTAKITPTKKPGAAASYKASVFLFMTVCFVTLLSF